MKVYGTQTSLSTYLIFKYYIEKILLRGSGFFLASGARRKYFFYASSPVHMYAVIPVTEPVVDAGM